jgi:hypothetical protein
MADLKKYHKLMDDTASIKNICGYVAPDGKNACLKVFPTPTALANHQKEMQHQKPKKVIVKIEEQPKVVAERPRKKPRLRKCEPITPPKRIEVLLDLEDDTEPGFWCGQVSKQDNDNENIWLIKFDDKTQDWINADTNTWRPCAHTHNTKKVII